MKHLLSVADIEQADFFELIDRSCQLVSRIPEKTLEGKCVGIEFRKTSTRTRTSFSVAAVRLGAYPMIYGPSDLQTNTGESIEDTTRVLGGYLDALVIRTAAAHSELVRMAELERMPIVNAMTAEEHPTQAISDFAFLKREFGRFEGLKVVYMGEGNNTAVALAYAASRIEGLSAEFYCPAGFGLSSGVLKLVGELSRKYGGDVRVFDKPFSYESSARVPDVLYTTRWQTTGTSKADAAWREKFEPFRITESLVEKISHKHGVRFMHDLPAVRGEECETTVLEGDHSRAFQQAEQKLFTAMAVFEWCIRH